MNAVVPILALVAVIAWLSMAGHGIALSNHPAPGMAGKRFRFSGYRFYFRHNFDPSAWPIHRRFMISAATFYLCIAWALVLSALGRYL